MGAIIRGFKSATAKEINSFRDTPGLPVWQRNDHERIVRDDNELNRIREYIILNPARWTEDEENPMYLKASVAPRYNDLQTYDYRRSL